MVVVNPNAGAGKCARNWPAIKDLLDDHGFNYEFRLTRAPGHAIQMVIKAIQEGFRNILAVGGDGTLNEVINGVFRQKTVATTGILVGMIPAGAGNDWSKMFGFPGKYKEVVKIIQEGKTFIQDAGWVKYHDEHGQQERYFANVAGMGLDSVVTRKTNKLKTRRIKSKATYFFNILTSLMGHRSAATEIIIDGESSRHLVFSMNIGIGKYSGGGMLQVPNAIPDDGLFNLTLIHKMSKLRILLNLYRLYNGKLLEHPKISTHSGSSIKIIANGSSGLETDGEMLGDGPYEFRVIPKSLKIISAV